MTNSSLLDPRLEKIIDDHLRRYPSMSVVCRLRRWAAFGRAAAILLAIAFAAGVIAEITLDIAGHPHPTLIPWLARCVNLPLGAIVVGLRLANHRWGLLDAEPIVSHHDRQLLEKTEQSTVVKTMMTRVAALGRERLEADWKVAGVLDQPPTH